MFLFHKFQVLILRVFIKVYGPSSVDPLIDGLIDQNRASTSSRRRWTTVNKLTLNRVGAKRREEFLTAEARYTSAERLARRLEFVRRGRMTG